MLERYHNIGGYLRLDPEGTLTGYADAQATIADLQGQAKDYQACRDVLDSTVLELTQVQQRVAQLEADNRTYINERHENMKTIETLQADHARVLGLVQALPFPIGELFIEPDVPEPRKPTWWQVRLRNDHASILLGEFRSEVMAKSFMAVMAYRASLPAQRAKLAQGGVE